MSSLSLKSVGLFGLGSAALAAVLTGAAAWRYNAATEDLVRAQHARYASYLLADELRQSSDDLTRLARTYVMSGDPKWEKQYFDILDIRNGKKPRPGQYQRIYWDFRAADIDPARGTDAAVPLVELMKQAGFSDTELGKLKEAAANSDDLVRTETVAMNLVKGLTADASGAFTVKGKPDLPKAQAMMHDPTYHVYKAKIMTPLDEFFVALDKRTQGAVDAATASHRLWMVVALAVMTLSGFGLTALLVLVYRQVARSLAGAVQASQALAAGDLATNVPVQGPNEVAGVLRALAQARAQLSSTVGGVRESAQSVATASVEISSGNNDLSARTEKQASALQQTAAAMEQISSLVRQSADHADQANQLAQSASAVAGRGGEVVGHVVETMKGINDSSKKIADIISVIDGISFQTNILALNAAVEAARAGEQGRGFAVVAGEVRTLAQRSAEAAKEIRGLITASVERVTQGTELVDQAGSTMTEVVSSIRRVADIIGEITQASREQSTGFSQVGQAVSEMDQSTQQNAALVEQSAAAAESLRQQADQLVRAVAVFQIA